MSWSIGPVVAKSKSALVKYVEEYKEASKAHCPAEAMDGIIATVEAMSTVLEGRAIYLYASGHNDPHYGNAHIEVKVVYFLSS
jgi:hypothetical protein